MEMEKPRQDTKTPAILPVFYSLSFELTICSPVVTTLRIVVLACLIFIPYASLPAQELPHDDYVLEILQRRIDEDRAIGLVAGLYESGKSPRIVTAGEAGEGARPFSEWSVFEIGSITKVLTASLLVEMAERGKVNLTDPVSEYLPERVHMPSSAGREITFLDLATHRAGLPVLPGNLEPADRANPYVDYTIEKLYEFLSEFKIEKEIGAEFEYSNVGFGLLGHVLTLVAEKKYEDLIRERILDPLGMTNTGIKLEGEAREWIVKGHDVNGVEVTPIDIPPSLIGAGVTAIVFLLSKEFTKWVLAANLIALPVAYYVMNRWLQNFAYRIEIGFEVLLLTAAVAFIIALFTVSYQSVRAALGNPVDALRYE